MADLRSQIAKAYKFCIVWMDKVGKMMKEDC